MTLPWRATAGLSLLLAGLSCASSVGPTPREDAGRVDASAGDATAEDRPRRDAYRPDALGMDCGEHPEEGCEDLQALERYPVCSASETQADCEANGGSWVMAPSGAYYCSCSTGQGSCSCCSALQCMKGCVAPTGPGGISDCAGLQSGHCNPVNYLFGCACWFDAYGEPSPACAD